MPALPTSITSSCASLSDPRANRDKDRPNGPLQFGCRIGAAMLLLVAWAASPAFAARVAASGPALAVDATMDRHAISPDIYGMNFGDTTLVQELHVPVNRYGGNAASRYNYVTNVHNLASDWYYENYPLGLQASDVTIDQFIAA